MRKSSIEDRHKGNFPFGLLNPYLWHLWKPFGLLVPQFDAVLKCGSVGEMTQALYAHMNNKTIKIKKKMWQCVETNHLFSFTAFQCFMLH
jgi:hypothetical protein